MQGTHHDKTNFTLSLSCVFFGFVKKWPKEVVCVSIGAMALMLLFGLTPPTVKEITQHLPKQSVEKTIAASWSPVTKPAQAFTLSAPVIERLPQTYQLWQHQHDAVTQDRLSIARFNDGGLHAQLNVTRSQKALQNTTDTHSQINKILERSFYLALVHASADQGLGVIRLGKSEIQTSKFGAVESADALLSDGRTERLCLAYRHLNTDFPLQLQGWFCADQQQVITRPMLGCFIDRIGLLNAGGDKRLRRFFADAELKREATCTQARLASTSNQKSNWLDMSASIPTLKTQSKNTF